MTNKKSNSSLNLFAIINSPECRKDWEYQIAALHFWLPRSSSKAITQLPSLEAVYRRFAHQYSSKKDYC